jgi:hypothetical protein
VIVLIKKLKVLGRGRDLFRYQWLVLLFVIWKVL